MRSFSILLLLVFFLNGCATKFNVPDEPRPIPACLFPSCIRLALVLGGGGARGMAHVGVLEEFERAGIPIDVIIGCSAGSVVGALYADCPDAGAVKSLAQPFKKVGHTSAISQCRYGLVQGRSFTKFLEKNLSVNCFEKLRIPLCIAATDLLEGKMVCLNSGPLISAVHASSAVPFVFAPVLLHERLLVDGGVTDPVPVCIAKKLGAEIIVAVDLSELLPKTCPTNLFGVAKRSAEIKFLLQSESCVDGADVVIRPELNGVGLFDDRNNELVYQAGRKAAREAIPKIFELLEQKGFWHTSRP